MEYNMRLGWIEVICGPMFAGKSEELIRRVKRMEYAKKKVLVFKPRIDNRYSECEIVSHAKSRTKSVDIDKAHDIYKYLEEDTYSVVIDEVQFLDSEVVEICETLASRGIRVIVAGLDLDFRGEPFSIMPELLARAESVTKLSAICENCGALATRTRHTMKTKSLSLERKKHMKPGVVIVIKFHIEPKKKFTSKTDEFFLFFSMIQIL